VAPCKRRLAALYSLLSTRYGHFKLNQLKCALAIISIPFRSIVSVALFQTADYLRYDGLALSLHSRALDRLPMVNTVRVSGSSTVVFKRKALAIIADDQF